MTTPPIRITFDSDDPELADRIIGALVDMTLTNIGATVEELDLAAIGTSEILEAVSATGTITSAEVLYGDDHPVFRLKHSARDVLFEAGALELAQTAFPTVNLAVGVVELHAANHIGGTFA